MRISKIQIIGNLVGLLPGALLLFRILNDDLSANPIQSATVITGRAAIYALLLSHYCSPLARIFRMSVFFRIRKIAGLFGFYYASAHVLTFMLFDYQLNLQWILPELKQKPFLQIGLIAFILLIPLAITSVGSLQITMERSWKKLHVLVYGITALVLLHVALASKGDIMVPAILISVYVAAIALRLPPLRSVRISSLPSWLKQVNTTLIQ